ncbi:heparin lyase I family protein [Aestuariibius sp. HNIBRBA575]|uniref:heparin lyase I family protein n=1 Tax=Aestuariibius sp. HNIBRBA575 TaxID=3233343 RepID=UPI0034A23727
MKYAAIVLGAFVIAGCQPTDTALNDADTEFGPYRTFATSFDDRPRYFPPHGPDTARQAASFDAGVAAFTIQPGMTPSSSDIPNGTERAEMGQIADGAGFVRQSFRVRVDPGFTVERRLMIAQIKQGRNTTFSPAIAVYLSEGGQAKCIDYTGDQQDQNIQSIRSHGINLIDGNWHNVVMEYVLSDTDGFCRVTVDNQIIVSMSGHDSDPDGAELAARIGPYRDKVDYPQTIYFDDWAVELWREIPF